MLNEKLESTTISNSSSSVMSNYANDTFLSRSFAVMLSKNSIPSFHKRVADNYLIVKKIFKFQACVTRISNVEKSLLEKYDFNILECTTMNQMYEELCLLQQWSNSNDVAIKNDAENILLIRVKELKSIEASRYASISNEIYNGYKVLEQYLKEISKFQNTQTMRTFVR